MRNRFLFFKLFHTVVFFFMSGCLIYILYCGITRTFDWTLLVALAAIGVEGVAILLNRGQCPLTTLAERYGAEKGSVSDLFVPQWLAINLFKVSRVVFAAELILLGVGYFTGK